MGRLPAMFAGRVITAREPYNIPGELILAENITGRQFPANTFDHNVDKPFEIHRVIPRISPLSAESELVTNNDGLEISQEILQSLVRIRIENTGRNQLLQKASMLMHLMTKGSSERTWEWAEPYYMIRGEGMQVSVDTLPLPVSFAALTTPITQLRIEVNFQGFNNVIAPPSDNR